MNLLLKKLLREKDIVAEYGDQDESWSVRFSTNPADKYCPETLHTAGFVAAALGLSSMLDPPLQVSTRMQFFYQA